MTVVEKPQDYMFRAGHRIGLNAQTEIIEWAIAKPYSDCTSADCNLVKSIGRAGEGACSFHSERTRGPAQPFQ